jgi:hypothetical protein
MKIIKLEPFLVTSERRVIELEVLDLQTSETVASVAVTHVPPSGSAETPSTSISSPYVYLACGPFTVTGLHTVTAVITGNASTPSKPAVRYIFDVIA